MIRSYSLGEFISHFSVPWVIYLNLLLFHSLACRAHFFLRPFSVCSFCLHALSQMSPWLSPSHLSDLCSVIHILRAAFPWFLCLLFHSIFTLAFLELPPDLLYINICSLSTYLHWGHSAEGTLPDFFHSCLPSAYNSAWHVVGVQEVFVEWVHPFPNPSFESEEIAFNQGPVI